MLDIHTHYDVEVLNGPSLSESLRHGVTTVMLGSCSLSTVHVDGVDAGDIFGPVEAIPREHVISAVDDHKTSGTVRSRDGVRKWQLRIRSWGCGRRCRPGTGTR
jgi:N-acyl-D-aspartate/D-glutamate deacylase